MTEDRFSEGLAKVTGSFRNTNEISTNLSYADMHYNLVSPATLCGRLPEGCVLVFSAFRVSLDETYPITRGTDSARSLSKVALDKFARAASVVWDPSYSERLDNGSQDHYCAYRAFGHVRNLDGSWYPITGVKQMDLRDGSAQVQKVLESSKDVDKGPRTLRDMRASILEHAETKARLRAIRTLGVKSNYTLDALEKPFVVVRISFNGETDDPVLRRLFAKMLAASFFGSSQTMFGAPPQFAKAGAGAQSVTGFAPPPIDMTGLDDEDGDGVIGEAAYPPQQAYVEPPRQAPPPPRAAPPPPPPPPAPSAVRGNHAGASGALFRFGKLKGQPLASGTDRDLQWYGEAIQNSINDPAKATYRAGNVRELNAVHAEQASRAAPQQSAAARTEPLPGIPQSPPPQAPPQYAVPPDYDAMDMDQIPF